MSPFASATGGSVPRSLARNPGLFYQLARPGDRRRERPTSAEDRTAMWPVQRAGGPDPADRRPPPVTYLGRRDPCSDPSGNSTHEASPWSPAAGGGPGAAPRWQITTPDHTSPSLKARRGPPVPTIHHPAQARHKAKVPSGMALQEPHASGAANGPDGGKARPRLALGGRSPTRASSRKCDKRAISMMRASTHELTIAVARRSPTLTGPKTVPVTVE